MGYQVPNGETAADYLEKLVYEGLQKCYKKITSKILNRAKQEILDITTLGYADYFLILHDIIQFAIKNDIVATGNGCTSSSILCYALGITKVDPLTHGLFFERLFNKTRKNAATVYIDVDSKRCDEVQEYIKAKYGTDYIKVIGLNVLGDIQKAEKTIRKEKHNFSIENINLSDKKVFSHFGKGNIPTEIIPFERQKFLQKLNPSRFEDIIAAIALCLSEPDIRLPEYIKGKNAPEKIVYLHKLLEPILAETYGTLIYQEQLMMILNEVGGFDLVRADNLRRNMGKRNNAAVAAEMKDFVLGATKRGVEPKTATEIYDSLCSNASFVFCKAHAATYAQLAYQTEYLGVYYPKEYKGILAPPISSLERQNARHNLPVYDFDIYKKGETAKAFEEIMSYEFASSELIVIGITEYSSELFVSLVFEIAKKHNVLAISGYPYFTTEVLKYCKRDEVNDFNFMCEDAKNDYNNNKTEFINTTNPLDYLWEPFLWNINIPIIDYLPFRYLRRKFKYSDSIWNKQKEQSEWIEAEIILSPKSYLKKLSEIANAHECQIVVFWPINNRNYDKRKDKRPKISDFCFSKTVQEYADGIYAVQFQGEINGMERNKENPQPELVNMFTLTSLKRLPRIEMKIEEQEELEAEETATELNNQFNDDLPF